jgi:hypothetical protein
MMVESPKPLYAHDGPSSEPLHVDEWPVVDADKILSFERLREGLSEISLRRGPRSTVEELAHTLGRKKLDVFESLLRATPPEREEILETLFRARTSYDLYVKLRGEVNELKKRPGDLPIPLSLVAEKIGMGIGHTGRFLRNLGGERYAEIAFGMLRQKRGTTNIEGALTPRTKGKDSPENLVERSRMIETNLHTRYNHVITETLKSSQPRDIDDTFRAMAHILNRGRGAHITTPPFDIVTVKLYLRQPANQTRIFGEFANTPYKARVIELLAAAGQ